jgi:hypothetical protein
MKVGSVEETITVTGESPIVDIQSAALTRSVTSETFKEIPSGGSWIQMAALVPPSAPRTRTWAACSAIRPAPDVQAHGSLLQDGVSMIDGLRIGNMYQSSNVTNMSLSPLLFDQVDIQLSGRPGETGTNGVIMNAIPRAGGNRFSGSALVNGSAPSLQGSNLTDDLKARGATTSTTLKTLYDINGAVGGPIKRDKVWFYATSRYFTNEYYLAERFYAVDPSVINRVRGQLAEGLRRHLHLRQQRPCHLGHQREAEDLRLVCVPVQGGPALGDRAAVQSVAGSGAHHHVHTQLSTFKWTYTATNKLLFEAGMAAGASPDTIKLDPDQVGHLPRAGRSRAALHLDHVAEHRQLRLPRSDRLRLRRPAAEPVVQRVGELRDRAPTTRRSGSTCSAATSGAVTTTTRPGGIWYLANRAANGAVVPAQVVIQAPAAGWAEQPELQPRPLRPGPLDRGPPHAHRRCAAGHVERVHRAVLDGPRTAGCRTATSVRRGEERAELEGRRPARVGGLRPVRQRQDGAQGERQPRRRAGLDPLRGGEQPASTLSRRRPRVGRRTPCRRHPATSSRSAI